MIFDELAGYVAAEANHAKAESWTPIRMSPADPRPEDYDTHVPPVPNHQPGRLTAAFYETCQ